MHFYTINLHPHVSLSEGKRQRLPCMQFACGSEWIKLLHLSVSCRPTSESVWMPKRRREQSLLSCVLKKTSSLFAYFSSLFLWFYFRSGPTDVP